MTKLPTVAATVTATPRSEFFQFRTRPASAAWIRAAAAERGITVSEFLREAADGAARNQLSRGLAPELAGVA